MTMINRTDFENELFSHLAKYDRDLHQEDAGDWRQGSWAASGAKPVVTQRGVNAFGRETCLTNC